MAIKILPVSGAGKLIGMVEYRGKVFVAFEGGLYRLEENQNGQVLVKVEFNREQT